MNYDYLENCSQCSGSRLSNTVFSCRQRKLQILLFICPETNESYFYDKWTSARLYSLACNFTTKALYISSSILSGIHVVVVLVMPSCSLVCFHLPDFTMFQSRKPQYLDIISQTSTHLPDFTVFQCRKTAIFRYHAQNVDHSGLAV
jgi:hypothetical protein